MAPGVIQNSETIINNSLETISTSHNGDLINEILAGDSGKSCPIDRFNFPITNGDVLKEEKKEIKKPVRKVIKPKVLKNHESHDYLYDRLYEATCPRVVSFA